MTASCVTRLLAAKPDDAPFEVVVVDNGSARSVAKTLTLDPAVEVRRSAENLGFAGGANLGLRDLEHVTYVALVNNDVEVSNGWLEPLLERLRAEPDAGAASPKMLFADGFREIVLEAPTHVPGRGDARALGVRVHDVVADGQRGTAPQYVSGFFGPQDGGAELGWFEWTGARAVLRVPVDTTNPADACVLHLSADRPTSVMVRTHDGEQRIEVTTRPMPYRVRLSGPPFDVVNNVGTIVRADGYGVDRGFLEEDEGQYDHPDELEAWCGGAVLLRADYLRDVGLFDDRLFLYYEDVELSLRGRPRWRYVYEPRSVVRHRHGATAIHGSSRTETLKERNRLLVLLRYSSGADALRAASRFLLATLSYARRDVVSPVLHGRRPSGAIVIRRLAAFGGFVRMAPRMRHSRLPAHIQGSGDR